MLNPVHTYILTKRNFKIKVHILPCKSLNENETFKSYSIKYFSIQSLPLLIIKTYSRFDHGCQAEGLM